MKKELPRGVIAALVIAALALVLGAGWYLVNRDTLPGYEPQRLGRKR